MITVPPNVAVISFHRNAIADQLGISSRGSGLFYDLCGKDHQAGARIAWTRGVGRLIDALEKVPSAKINTSFWL
ncbi:hypothetical protein H1R20_g7685, partial [Candolleomyces eurysporus]